MVTDDDICKKNPFQPYLFYKFIQFGQICSQLRSICNLPNICSCNKFDRRHLWQFFMVLVTSVHITFADKM